MSKSNDFETDLLLLILNNIAIANLGNAGGVLPSTVAGSVYVALHTADPGEAGNQSTSETSYTGYGRVAVVRSASGWTVTGNQAVNAGVVTFGACTVGTPTLTHFSVGYQSAGATKILYKAPLNANLAVAPGITPSFAAGALTITED